MNLQTTTDWWISTRRPPGMLRGSGVPVEIEAGLRAMAGIDAALIAIELGIGLGQVIRAQRQLGLRPLTGAGRYQINMRGHNTKRKTGTRIARM